MAEDFIQLCETLWRDWLEESLDVSPFVDATFDMNAAPEPYVSFNAGRRPLIALTTNPGQTMPHQLRSHVQQGKGLLNRGMNYAEAASPGCAYAGMMASGLRRLTRSFMVHDNQAGR